MGIYFDMKKTEYIKDLNDIKEMVGKVRSINESINFDDDFDDADFAEEEGEEIEEPAPAIENDMKEEPSAEEEGLAELDKMGEIDKIREITLKGMIKLCNTPENPEYQALLKIFNMCNKASMDRQDNEAPQAK